MGRRTSFAGVLVLAGVLAAGCNGGPAREALGEAEQAIEDARPQLEAYAPEELASLRSAVQESRAGIDAGRYTDALRLAQRLPARIHDALGKGSQRKAELEAEWAALEGRVPAVIRGVGLRLDELAARPPQRSLEPETLGEARARLAEVTRAWAQADSRLAAGRPLQAVAAGREVASGTEALAARIGLTPASAAALANAAAQAAQAAAAQAAQAAAAQVAASPRATTAPAAARPAAATTAGVATAAAATGPPPRP